MTTPEARRKREIRTNRLLIVNLVLVTALAVWQLAAVNPQTSDIHSALCVLRQAQEDHVTSSRDFLRAHPHGIPGISASVIRQGIASNLRTVEALSPLDC